jgi:hypothetical protein
VDKLATYAKRKGLTVSVGKCATLVFQRRGEAEGQPVLFEDAPILFVQQFRYLGVTFTSALNMVHVAEQTAASLFAGGGRCFSLLRHGDCMVRRMSCCLCSSNVPAA